MPYKDPQKKIDATKRWRRESIEKGYGKWLYQRRKLLLDNAERFQLATVVAIHALEQDVPDVEAALTALIRAINDADAAEQVIGNWVETERHGRE